MTSEQPAQDPSPVESSPGDAAEQPPSADDPLRGSRTSGIWIGVVVLVLVLALLAVLVLQNTQEVSVRFLAWEGSAPLSAALLIAAVVGMLAIAIAGGLRIWQLRRRVRRVSS